MEMQDITGDKERIKEDEGASDSVLDVKTEASEEAEQFHYSKLRSRPEDIYSEASFIDPPAKTKAGKQTGGSARLYRAGCVFLTILSLVLLLVVIILSVKLQTGSAVCPQKQETAEQKTAPICDNKQCQTFIQSHLLGCQQCADGWLTLGRSCFYLSTFRLSWDKSQMNCTARGGSLAVITSQSIQEFLTKEGKLKYWIGLRQKVNEWTWVNNTVLQESYWAEAPPRGNCGMLSSGDPPQKNWIKASCDASTYFICQVKF